MVEIFVFVGVCYALAALDGLVIKHKKAATDAKRGKIFSKLGRTITIAAKEGGGNPNTNSKLKDAIEYARSFNLPKDNIDRAVKKGTGEIAGATLMPYTLEAFGPGGMPLLIETITDNKNRTLTEIKIILNRHNGKFAGEGSVKWQFIQRGMLELKSKNEKLNRDEAELAMIEAGADDIEWGNDTATIYVPPENLTRVKTDLQNKGFEIESSGIEWTPKEKVVDKDEKTKTALNKLFEELDEQDDVQNIYSNVSD